jgi:hypothetical protein
VDDVPFLHLIGLLALKLPVRVVDEHNDSGAAVNYISIDVASGHQNPPSVLSQAWT